MWSGLAHRPGGRGELCSLAGNLAPDCLPPACAHVSLLRSSATSACTCASLLLLPNEGAHAAAATLAACWRTAAWRGDLCALVGPPPSAQATPLGVGACRLAAALLAPGLPGPLGCANRSTERSCQLGASRSELMWCDSGLLVGHQGCRGACAGRAVKRCGLSQTLGMGLVATGALSRSSPTLRTRGSA